jgi:hypothetical protein
MLKYVYCSYVVRRLVTSPLKKIGMLTCRRFFLYVLLLSAVLFQCYEGRTISVLSVSIVETVEFEEAPVELPSPSPVPSESSNIDNLVTP